MENTMIGKMLNAIVAASVITAAAGAQDQPRPPRQGGTTERPQPQQPQGERARVERAGTPGTTPAVRATDGRTGDGDRDQPGRRLGDNARPDDKERPNVEALVFRFLAEHPEFIERLIARADRDGDGRLSPDERAQMREQLRARAQERREDRQDFREERRDDVQDFRQERRDDVQDFRQDRQDDRQDFREERRDDLQDFRQDRQDDRQDFRDDRRDDHADNRQDRVEGRAENRQDRVEGRAPNRQDGTQERVETRGRPAPTPPRVGPGGRGRQ
jgi:hypothetical protein